MDGSLTCQSKQVGFGSCRPSQHPGIDVVLFLMRGNVVGRTSGWEDIRLRRSGGPAEIKA